VTDAAGAVVLTITAMTMFAAGQMVGGRLRRVLMPMACNVLAVGAIFAAFAYSVPVGMDVRPFAKAADGLAAVVAAIALRDLAGD